MPSVKFTPTDQTASAFSSDGAPSPDTDVALLAYAAGGAENIVVSVTADYSGDDDGGASVPVARTQYSFDGAAWTTINEETGNFSITGQTDTASCGAGSLANFRVRAYADTSAGGASVPEAACDITAWFVTFDVPGMVVEA